MPGCFSLRREDRTVFAARKPRLDYLGLLDAGMVIPEQVRDDMRGGPG